MAEIKYTKAQERAVYYPDGDLLLSAAAGSGKTAALTGRIVQLIIEGRAMLSEMLIVTFTKASAMEMRTRITKLLRSRMEEHGAKNSTIASRLSTAITQVSSAQISTIHSFLYSVLKPYFPNIGLTQDCSIADPKEIEDLKKEIMAQVVEDFFKKDEKVTYKEEKGQKVNFIILADAIGQARDTTALDEELLWLHEKLESFGSDYRKLSEWGEECKKIAEDRTEPTETNFGKMVIADIKEFAEHYLRIFRELEDEFENEPKIAEKYGATLESCLEWVKELGTKLASENVSFEALKNHFVSYSPEKLGRLSKKDSTETAEIFKKYREEIKKEIGKYISYYFSADIDEFHLAASKTAEILNIAAVVLDEFENRLEQKKHSMSLIEYGDLEKYATDLLIAKDGKSTKEAEEIGAAYKYIFVDEYQDTNRIQDNIFKAISKNSVRFMVGDIKQSIYRFRGADPRVFSEYRRSWQKDEMEEYADERINIGKSIFMSENFRCSREIISFINAVSGTILPYGGIPYEREDELIYARNSDDPKVPVEVVLIEKTANSEEIEDNLSRKKENSEAKYVARRIKSMLGRYLEDSSKVVEPSDIAILLRSPNANGADYKNALEELRIPAATKTTKALGEYRTILLVMSLIKFIDNPLRDVYAAGAMISPIFKFTIDDVVELRKISGEMPLYVGVTEACGGIITENLELIEKCEKLTSFLKEEKLICDTIAPEKYIENLLEKTEIYHIEEVRNSPQERDALQKLLSLAKDFERKAKPISTGKTLYGFIGYLEEFLSEEMEQKDDTKGDAVSIMSIHASKGLEFPVCFLCETAKKRNKSDETRTLLFDDDLGFGMYLPDSTGLIKCDNLIRRAISKKISVDSVQEEMRMLYVALTRARTKLIVTAKTKSAETMLSEAQVEAEFSDAYSVNKADSYIDWILGGIIKNQHSEDWRILTVAEENFDNDEIIAEEMKEESYCGEEVTAIAEAIKSRFDFKYPHDYLAKIPSKLVVSRLSPEILDEDGTAESAANANHKDNIVQLKIDYSVQIESPDEDIEEVRKPMKKPQFMLGERHAAANEIGTATHNFLQFVDLRNLAQNGLEAEIRRLIENKFISANDEKIINIRELRKFMQSSLFDSMNRSDFVKREFRFNVLMDAHEFTDNDDLKEDLRKNNVKITVQGVVDCVYRDPDSGKLVLIDYKTDSIKPDEWKNQKKAEQRLAERHRHQLTYYRRICSEMFEEEIEEVYIYSTPLGRCIRI